MVEFNKSREKELIELLRKHQILNKLGIIEDDLDTLEDDLGEEDPFELKDLCKEAGIPFLFIGEYENGEDECFFTGEGNEVKIDYQDTFWDLAETMKKAVENKDNFMLTIYHY